MEAAVSQNQGKFSCDWKFYHKKFLRFLRLFMDISWIIDIHSAIYISCFMKRIII